MKKFGLIFFLIYFTFYSMAFAETKGDGGVPGSFLNIGTGARALGMGGAFVGLSDDSSCVYWNPAGLAYLKKPEITAFHSSLWVGAIYDFLSFAYPFKKRGSFAVSNVRQAVGDVEKREHAFSDPTTFGDIQNGLFLSYSSKFYPNFSFGFNLKSIYHKLDTYSGTGWGGDIGLLYKRFNNVSFGLNLQNILPPKMRLKRVTETFPLNVKLGLAYTVSLGSWLKTKKNLKDKFLLAFDMDKTAYRSFKFHLGGEYCFFDTFSLRFGYGRSNITAGAGLRYYNYRFDYAFVPYDFENIHRFSATVQFGYTRTEEEKFAKKKEERVRKEKEKLMKREEHQKAKELYINGLAHYEKGEFTMAILEWDKALIWEPDNEEILEKIKEANDKEKRMRRKKDIEKHFIQAHTFYSQGKIIESLSEWKKVLELDPANRRAQEQIGKISAKFSKEEKEKYFQETQLRKQKNIKLHLEKAESYYNKGKYNLATNEWKKVLELDTENLQAKNGIGKAKNRIQNLIKTTFLKGVQLYNKKEFGKAASEFRTVLRIDPEYMEAKEYMQKIKKVGKIDERDKKEANRFYAQARRYLFEEKWWKAESALKRALEKNPTHKNAQRLLEQVLIRIKRIEEKVTME